MFRFYLKVDKLQECANVLLGKFDEGLIIKC